MTKNRLFLRRRPIGDETDRLVLSHAGRVYTAPEMTEIELTMEDIMTLLENGHYVEAKKAVRR